MTQRPVQASHANWRNAPNSRWAFRHIAHVLPTATIRNDGQRLQPLPEALRDVDDFQLAPPGGETMSLDALLRQTHTDGFLVLADGRRVLECSDEGMAPDTRHILMSATKSVIGLLCGVMVDMRLLDPQAPVTHYMPELGHTGYQGANVRHLMDMRAEPRLDGDDLRRYTASTNWDPLPAGANPGGMHAFLPRCQPVTASTADRSATSRPTPICSEVFSNASPAGRWPNCWATCCGRR
jgi:CubicO group peptidase (beta-lactamase class C family)